LEEALDLSSDRILYEWMNVNVAVKLSLFHFVSFTLSVSVGLVFLHNIFKVFTVVQVDCLPTFLFCQQLSY